MVLTSTDIYSRAKEFISRTWVDPPVHPGYFQRHPGSAVSFKGSRSYQTPFSRFSTGHLRCMNFEGGKRSFPIYPKCNISPFSPQHILQCLGFSCEEAVAPPPLLFLDFVQIYGFMDLVTEKCLRRCLNAFYGLYTHFYYKNMLYFCLQRVQKSKGVCRSNCCFFHNIFVKMS
ncbi:UNVERIFIED_CONTAM: hypothetical protein NCL1_33668 [Trichonephila clavipes]